MPRREAKTVIHVHGGFIKANNKMPRDERNPVFIVQKGSRPTRRGDEVFIEGPSRVVYNPDKPRHNGAKAWIETESHVVVLNKGLAIV